MRPVDPFEYAKAPTQGGSARVSEVVSRVVQAHKGQPQMPRDPAPSRTQYRVNRLMLTPSVRALLRLTPALLVCGAVGLWMSVESNRQMAFDFVADMQREMQNRPEFMVKVMAVDGASDEVAADIRAVMGLEFPLSSFALDLELLHQQITALGAVKTAELHVRAGGILQVDVTERSPAMVWRSQAGVKLIDDSGYVISQTDSRLNHPELPLIVGDGAHDHAAQAMQIFAAAAPFKDRLRGLVRIGDRRWDMVLDRDQVIRLPAGDPIGALAQVVALDEAKDLLDRDITVVDMRNLERPTLQLSAPAQTELRRIMAIEMGGN